MQRIRRPANVGVQLDDHQHHLELRSRQARTATMLLADAVEQLRRVVGQPRIWELVGHSNESVALMAMARGLRGGPAGSATAATSSSSQRGLELMRLAMTSSRATDLMSTAEGSGQLLD